MSMRTLMRIADLELSGLGPDPVPRDVLSALNCIYGVAQVRMVPDECRARVTYDAFKVFPHQFETAVGVMGCEIERLIIRPEPLSAIDHDADAEVRAASVRRSEVTHA